MGRRRRDVLGGWIALSLAAHAAAGWLLRDESPGARAALPEPSSEIRLAVALRHRAPPPRASPSPPAAEAPAPAPAPRPKKRAAPREATPPPEPKLSEPPAPETVAEVTEPEALTEVAVTPPAAAAVEASAPAPDAGAVERYIALVRVRIDERKQYPAMARRRGVEGIVSLRLALDGSGRVTALDPVAGSPRMLWRPTERAIRDAGPFPPPPDGPLKIDLGIHYELE